MCRADYSDGYATTLREQHQRARKPHHCSECRRTIRVGEIYLTIVSLFDGNMDVLKQCVHCENGPIKWLMRECSGYLYTQAEEDLREHWVEYGIRTRELAELIFGMGRMWTKRNGELMVVPIVLKTEEGKS